MSRFVFQASVLGLAVLSLTACGGNSNSTPTQATPVVQPATNTGNTNTNNANAGNTNTGTTTTRPSTTTGTTNTNTTTTTNQANQVTGTYVVANPQDIREGLREDFRASQISAITITVDGKAQNTIDLASLPNGISSKDALMNANFLVNNQAHTGTGRETVRILKQPNSVVIGTVDKGGRISGASINQTFPSETIADFDYFTGNATKTLPNNGIVNYVGKSFDNDSEGTFNYNIDFGAKIGQGQVVIDNKTATLHATRIGNITRSEDNQVVFSGYGVGEGRVSGNIVGDYHLGIFGNNAEEVAGYIDNDNDRQTDVGFAGSKK